MAKSALHDAPTTTRKAETVLSLINVSKSFGPVKAVDRISIDVIEYRNGNDKESGTHKLPGLARYENVILRRGIIGSLSLYDWINQVRNGDANARRTVTITLLAEDLSAVLTWKLLRAWPVKYSFGDLNAKGTDVAIEELVLAYERLEME